MHNHQAGKRSPQAPETFLLPFWANGTSAYKRVAIAAAAARREAAQLLREEGLPIRDVGVLIGVSHQRVSQILAS